MHSFTIALISTLSLGVHAASIGDSVSQLVTREQHNRLFHNPDFASANLPAAESFERAGKLSPRVASLVNGLLGFNDNINAGSNTQAVPNAQTPSVPATATNAQAISAAANDGNTGLNTADTRATNAQAPQAQAVTNTPQFDQTILQAAAVDLDVLALLFVQLSVQLSVAVNAQGATISVTALATIIAQIRAQTSVALTSSQEASNKLEAYLNNQLEANTAVNAATPATLSSGVGLGLFVGAKRDSQQDAVKRQLPASVGNATQIATNGLNHAGLITGRGDNTKYFDDHVEDMDFSAHDSEADDELEEGF